MSACVESLKTETESKVTGLSPQIAAMFHGKNDVIFVDPRPANAISATTGIIPGAHNIALDDIRDGKLPADLDPRATHVITSCQAGPMGEAAAQALFDHGFARVNYVKGGTQAWLDAGYHTDR